jgi:hypothetical protein
MGDRERELAPRLAVRGRRLSVACATATVISSAADASLTSSLTSSNVATIADGVVRSMIPPY